MAALSRSDHSLGSCAMAAAQMRFSRSLSAFFCLLSRAHCANCSMVAPGRSSSMSACSGSGHWSGSILRAAFQMTSPRACRSFSSPSSGVRRPCATAASIRSETATSAASMRSMMDSTSLPAMRSRVWATLAEGSVARPRQQSIRIDRARDHALTRRFRSDSMAVEIFRV